jgi:hypothetical protein
LHASTVLAEGVGGDFVAPDSLLQEVDILLFHFLFFILIFAVKNCNFKPHYAGYQSCGGACAHPWSI